MIYSLRKNNLIQCDSTIKKQEESEYILFTIEQIIRKLMRTM